MARVGSINIVKSTFVAIHAKEASKIENIFFEEATLGLFSAYKATITNVSIKKSKIFGIVLEYLSHECKTLYVEYSCIEGIKFHLDKPIHLLINKESQIRTLSLENGFFAKDVILQISDTQIGTFSVGEFINAGLITIKNIRPLVSFNQFISHENRAIQNASDLYDFELVCIESSVRFINSDLGKTQIIGCDFRQFNNFVFRNTKMLEMFVVDSFAPSVYKIDTFFENRKSDGDLSESNTETKTTEVPLKTKKAFLLHQQRLFASQLRKIFEQQGDFVTANKFQTQTLEIYRMSLQNIDDIRFFSKKWFDIKVELLNLNLNRYSNFFGQNWLRGLILTLVANAILYTLYCRSLGYRLGPDFNLFYQLASFSLEFLNPVHKPDLIRENVGINSTNLSRVVDSISRVITAYLVYQTIQAFRKHGKRQ